MKNIKLYSGIVIVVLFWLLTPLYLQMRYGYSAVKISFIVTVFYYLGFNLWKRLGTGSEQQ